MEGAGSGSSTGPLRQRRRVSSSSGRRSSQSDNRTGGGNGISGSSAPLLRRKSSSSSGKGVGSRSSASRAGDVIVEESGDDELEEDRAESGDLLDSSSRSGDETIYDSRDTLEDAAHNVEESFSGPAHYLPLIVAVVPPLGAILHGRAEAWTDLLILLLVAFYLYQVVRVPWELYYASRTRRINAATYTLSQAEEGDVPAAVLQRRKAAQHELVQQELLSLAMCVLSPFIGSYLLYYVKGALSDPDRYINPFNVRLFVLASGVKPWSHLFRLIKQRSLFLQSEVHYPVPTVAYLMKRVQEMEEQINGLRGVHATKQDVRMLREGIDVPLTKLSKAIKNFERKEEFVKLNNEEKFDVLDQKLDFLLRELNASLSSMEQLKLKQERSGSVLRALRYIFSGESTHGRGRIDAYAWYERGPFFYIFLPVIASNRILDATGRLFDTLTRRIGYLERSGMIEGGATQLQPRYVAIPSKQIFHQSKQSSQ